MSIVSMNVGNFATNLANAVSPFNPVGRQPVGEENTENKNSSFKSVEESAESARGQNRTASQDGSDKVPGTVNSSEEDGESESAQNQANDSTGDKSSRKQREEKRQEFNEQQEIRELASRDREVRAHEQAHAAVGGRYAGGPQYQFKRGPDGVNYAVSGEVSIDTSKVSNDPAATINKAQQIRRAALAPAEPSPQDRRVAARATQMEVEARKELVELQQQEAKTERETRLQENSERQEQEQVRQQRGDEVRQERATREASFKEQSDLQRSFQQRLIDIGVTPIANEIGRTISESV